MANWFGRDKSRFTKSLTMKKIALSLFVIAASGAYVWSQAGSEPSNALPGLPPLIGGAKAEPVPAPAETTTGNAPVVSSQSLPPNPPRSQDGTGQAAAPARTPPDDLSRLLAALEAEGLLRPLPAPQPTTPSTPTAAAPPQLEIPIPRPRPADRPPVASEPPRRQPTTSNSTPSVKLASSGMYADGAFTGPVEDAYYGLVQVEAIVQNGQLVSIKVLRYPNDRNTSRFINGIALPRLRREVIRAQSARVNIISGATLTSEAFLQSLDGALRQARA